MSLWSTSPFRLLAQAKPKLERLAAKGLGLLIAWQLLFIPLANYLEFYPHRMAGTGELTDYRELAPGSPQVYPVVNGLSRVTDAWAQVTGQYQMWWLFAPQFPPASTFPEVKVTWKDEASDTDNETVSLRSSFEPPASGDYFRLSPGSDRLFLYEMHLGIGLTWWKPHEIPTDADEIADWQKHFRSLAQRQRQSLTQYALWRAEAYFAEHPDQKKQTHELVLGMNWYSSDKTAQAKALPPAEFIPILRLTRALDASGIARVNLVEAYDPVSREYWNLDSK